MDESYNSSPEAIVSALQNLKSLKVDSSRIIAILGDMKELGDNEIDFHKNIESLSEAGTGKSRFPRTSPGQLTQKVEPGGGSKKDSTGILKKALDSTSQHTINFRF